MGQWASVMSGVVPGIFYRVKQECLIQRPHPLICLSVPYHWLNHLSDILNFTTNCQVSVLIKIGCPAYFTSAEINFYLFVSYLFPHIFGIFWSWDAVVSALWDGRFMVQIQTGKRIFLILKVSILTGGYIQPPCSVGSRFLYQCKKLSGHEMCHLPLQCWC